MKRVYGDAPALNLRPVEPSLVSAQLVEELEGTQNERKGKSAAQQKKPEVVAPPPAPIAPKLSPEEELQKRGNDTRGETLLQRKGSEPRGAKPTVLLTREQIAAVANRRPTVGMRRGARAGIGALAVVALSGLLLIARAKLSPTGPVERAPVLSAGRQPDPPRPEPILEPVPSVAERKLELPPVIVEKAPPLPPLEDKKPIAAPVKPVAARLPPLPVVAAGPVDVTVRLSAWAYVWADGETFNTGREVAPPATRVLKLAPGAHVVHLSNDDTGVKKFDVAVLVRPGKPVRIEGTADHAAVKE